MESPVPLSISYRPYVLEMPAEDDFDGTALSLCLVVIKRDNGMILAVSQSFIPDDVLESAMQAGTEEVLLKEGFLLLDLQVSMEEVPHLCQWKRRWMLPLSMCSQSLPMDFEP